jgi:hypothetical protein
VHFCYKHSLSCVLSNATVYDRRTLEQELNRSWDAGRDNEIMSVTRIIILKYRTCPNVLSAGREMGKIF